MRKRGAGRVAVVYIALAGMQRGMPLIILPFLAQVMAPAEFGAASMLTATSLLLSTALAGPLEALVFRTAARSDDSSPAILRITGLYCYAAMPIFLVLVSGLIAVSRSSILGISSEIWALALLAAGFQPAMTYYALPLIQAQQRLGTYTQLALFSSLTIAVSKLLLLMVFGLGVLGWVLSDLIAATTSACLAVALVRLPRAAVSSEDVRFVVRFAIPLVPHRSASWVMSYASRPIMAVVSTMTQVGLLSLGLNLASIVTLIISEINRTVMPNYSREKFPAPTQITSTIVTFQLILAFVCPAIIGSMVAVAGQFVFPESYWPAFSLLGILLIGQVAIGLYCVPASYLIQTAGITKPVGLASTVGAAVQIGLMLLLGSVHGAEGAAIATVTGFVVMAMVAFAVARTSKLKITWTIWLRHWPQFTLAISALVGGIVALYSEVGSAYAYVFAGLSIAVSVVTLMVCAKS